MCGACGNVSRKPCVRTEVVLIFFLCPVLLDLEFLIAFLSAPISPNLLHSHIDSCVFIGRGISQFRSGSVGWIPRTREQKPKSIVTIRLQTSAHEPGQRRGAPHKSSGKKTQPLSVLAKVH